MIGLAFAVAAATPNDPVQSYIFCVRRMAVRLEPSGETPTDIAGAAKLLCGPEREAALKSSLDAGGGSTTSISEMENSAEMFGKSDVVVSRLCRKTKDCIP